MASDLVIAYVCTCFVHLLIVVNGAFGCISVIKSKSNQNKFISRDMVSKTSTGSTLMRVMPGRTALKPFVSKVGGG